MTRTQITRGERAPDFVLPRGDGQRARFYGGVGGVPTVLVFTGSDAIEQVRSFVDAWHRQPDDVAALRVVTTADAGWGEESFHDLEGAVHRAYGVAADGAPVVIVLDRNVRVAEACELDHARVARAVAALATERSGADAQGHAPVLFVPRVLELARCAELVAVWHDAGSVATGVEATVGSGRAETADEQRKRRRDHIVNDPGLLRQLTHDIGRRVMPELRKAFAYRATRFEGFKIGCYEAADEGFFEPHRDNLSPATAHRSFGLTLNLNDDYEGGELRFPEYGTRRYRPAAGEALVFSGAHLHEVLPVTRGRRFVLLSFLFGGEQAAPA